MNKMTTNEKRAKQRKLLNRYIDRPVTFLIKHNISPNHLSFLGFLCSLSAAFFVAIGTVHCPVWISWLAPFFMFWAGVFDIFDGEVARRTKGESHSGAFLDSNLDRLSDAIIVVGLIYGNLIDYILGFIIIFLIVMIPYTRSRAENEGLDMKGVGLMERAERSIYIMILLSFESWIYFLTLVILGTPFILFFLVGIWIFMALLILTLIQRVAFTYRSLRKTKNKGIK